MPVATDAEQLSEAAAPAPLISPLLPGEQSFELIVPDGCIAGSSLEISLPGIGQKLKVTVPEDAQPGRSVSFTLKGLPNAAEAHAAAIIQSVQRGRASRAGTSSARTAYAPRGHAAPPYETEGARADPVQPREHDPSLYPTLATSDAAAAEPPPPRAVYAPRGHAAPPLPLTEPPPGSPPHDASLYPTLASPIDEPGDGGAVESAL